MTDKPTRRDLMRPIHLLGLAFLAAVFAGLVTLVSMGFFQARPADQIQQAITVALVVAGITFIAVLVILALLILAVDPVKEQKPFEGPVLLPDEPDDADGDAAPKGPTAS